MRKTFTVIFTVFCIVFTDAAYSDCPSTTDVDVCQSEAGCVLYTGTCRPCDTHQYRDTTTTPYTCKACTNGPTDQSGKACGAEGASCQYTGNNGDNAQCKWTMTCSNKSDFANGTWAPDSATITYNGTGTAPTCTYDLKKITCNTTGNSTCSNRGFHLDGESCVSNVQSCENNGYKFYTNNTWSDCYVSSCASDETLIPKETCGTTPYGICKPKGIDCNSASAQTAGLTASACSGGTISGTAQLSGTTYDFSSCTCQKGQAVSTINGTPINGTAIETCHFSSNGNSLSTTCSQELQTCNNGYCNQSGQTCVSVPAGYYSTGTEKECRKCPAGATSAAGSTAKTACHYTSTTTFADSVGNFTLPASGNIEIKWNWQ